MPPEWPNAESVPYISSIGRMGLWSAKDSLYRLADAGDDLLGRAEDDAVAARRAVLNIKLGNVEGYQELLSALSVSPVGFEALDALLKEKLAELTGRAT
jgi:hypothetical protein